MFTISSTEGYELHADDYAEMQEVLASEEYNAPVSEFSKDGYVPTEADLREMAEIFAAMDETIQM